MRLTWLADVLRSAGLVVVEHDGWRERGKDLTSVEGIVCHHTATGPTWTDAAVCRLLIEGRSDLRGPLAHLGLDRQGRWHVIAAGKCNHNGYGTWGNSSIGVEAFNDGRGEPWPEAQVGSWMDGCAAICGRTGWDPAHQVRAHRETDPSRKIDPTGIDMGAFRAGVAARIAPPTDQEDLLTMAAKDANDARHAQVREWFRDYLGRGFSSYDEQALHVWVMATKGADVCLAGILDSPEGQAYAARHKAHVGG